MSTKRIAVGITYVRCFSCNEKRYGDVLIDRKITTQPEGEHEVDGEHEVGIFLCDVCQTESRCLKGLNNRAGIHLVEANFFKNDAGEGYEMTGRIMTVEENAFLTMIDDSEEGKSTKEGAQEIRWSFIDPVSFEHIAKFQQPNSGRKHEAN